MLIKIKDCVGTRESVTGGNMVTGRGFWKGKARGSLFLDERLNTQATGSKGNSLLQVGLTRKVMVSVAGGRAS